ncbi:MAG: hypothetical protein ACT4O1_01880 [Gemmatimonadota bacterium]
MTVAALPVRTALDMTCYERTVSDDARRIADRLQDLVHFPDPFATSSSKGEALELLNAVYMRALRPNWDREGSAAVVPATLTYAKHFLGLLPSRFPEPDIYAEPDGEVAFEWDFGPRKVFSVSVSRDGTLTYAGLFGPSKAHGVETMVDRLPDTIRIALDRVSN